MMSKSLNYPNQTSGGGVRRLPTATDTRRDGLESTYSNGGLLSEISEFLIEFAK